MALRLLSDALVDVNRRNHYGPAKVPRSVLLGDCDGELGNTAGKFVTEPADVTIQPYRHNCLASWGNNERISAAFFDVEHHFDDGSSDSSRTVRAGL